MELTLGDLQVVGSALGELVDVLGAEPSFVSFARVLWEKGLGWRICMVTDSNKPAIYTEEVIKALEQKVAKLPVEEVQKRVNFFFGNMWPQYAKLMTSISSTIEGGQKESSSAGTQSGTGSSTSSPKETSRKQTP